MQPSSVCHFDTINTAINSTQLMDSYLSINLPSLNLHDRQVAITTDYIIQKLACNTLADQSPSSKHKGCVSLFLLLHSNPHSQLLRYNILYNTLHILVPCVLAWNKKKQTNQTRRGNFDFFSLAGKTKACSLSNKEGVRFCTSAQFRTVLVCRPPTPLRIMQAQHWGKSTHNSWHRTWRSCFLSATGSSMHLCRKSDWLTWNIHDQSERCRSFTEPPSDPSSEKTIKREMLKSLFLTHC